MSPETAEKIADRQEAVQIAREQSRGPNDLWWQDFSECKDTDPDLFFPERGNDVPGSVKAAKEICKKCLVIDDCLEYHLRLKSEEDYGVAGGMSKNKRDKIRKQQKIVVA